MSSDITTRIFRENKRTWIERRRGDLLLRREITNDIEILNSPVLAQAEVRHQEIQQWHDWAGIQLLEAKLTDL